MIWSAFCLSRPYHLKFFKGCLPQILPGPFLNTLSHLFRMYTFSTWCCFSFFLLILFLELRPLDIGRKLEFHRKLKVHDVFRTPYLRSISVLRPMGSVMPPFTQNIITMFQCKNAKKSFVGNFPHKVIV